MTAIGNKRWRVISPHLDRALDMSTGERTVWLSALQAEDPALAAELQLLLEEQKAICETHFLEHGPSVPNEAPSLAGQTLGAYTLESPLGEGGMGIVWLARRSDGRFEGKAAIRSQRQLIGRSAKHGSGAKARSSADHPSHVAHHRRRGRRAGQPCLVLEYIEGEAIDRYCDAQALDVEERIRLFLDVLSAVAHAHTNLIVHRDLKPSNVLVAKGGNVKLLDFGIAKLLEDDPRPDQVTQITREGRQALTPEYAAPEQVLGEPVTTATDVYALGVLLYVLLGGQHPAGDRTKSPAELIKSIVETQPPRLSDTVASTKTVTRDTLTDNATRRAATPAKLKRVLQGDLDNIVAKALKKDPQERYATITALAEDLRRYLDHQPVSARPDSIRYRTAKFVRRHRSMVAAGLLVVLAVAAGLAGTVTQARRAEAQPLKAHHERDRAQRELAGTEAMEEFMTFLLASKADKPFTVRAVAARRGAGAPAVCGRLGAAREAAAGVVQPDQRA
jgi:serine/threonine-protein kinase